MRRKLDGEHISMSVISDAVEEIVEMSNDIENVHENSSFRGKVQKLVKDFMMCSPTSSFQEVIEKVL